MIKYGVGPWFCEAFVGEQRIALSAQEGGVQISSIVAPLNELEHRSEWAGAPTVENIWTWGLQSTNELTLASEGARALSSRLRHPRTSRGHD